jgi:hypothetical protein
MLANGINVLLFCHHQNSLDEETLQNLGTHSLKESEDAFMLDDEAHHLYETAEGLSFSRRRWLRL